MECMDYLACMYMFDVLRKCHTLFLKWLYYCKQVAFGTASLLFLVVSTLLSVWEYFTGIIIQISLKTMMLIIFSCSTYFHLYIIFIEVCVQCLVFFLILTMFCFCLIHCSFSILCLPMFLLQTNLPVKTLFLWR